MKGEELDRLVFKAKRDGEFTKRLLTEEDKVLNEFNLTQVERDAISRRDYRKLSILGLKPELVLWLAKITREEQRRTE